MRPHLLLRLSICCLAALPYLAFAADVLHADSSVTQAETMVLRATLNTQDKGDVYVERVVDGDFLLKVEDLKSMGLRDLTGTIVTVNGELHLSLRSVAGVSYVFRQKELILDISAEPRLLPETAIKLRGEGRRKGAVSEGTSAFFNYAINHNNGTGSSVSRFDFAGEAGWSYRDFLFLSNAGTSQDGSGKLVRLTSSVTHDDRATLRRWVIGDFFSPTREFDNGANLGGISLSKNYALNPYLIAFPTPSIKGSVALPSDLEVYLDGQRIRSERLGPGQFELSDILAYGGTRNVQLVLRDAFGRVRQLDYSFYFSDLPLQQGLHEYSYNLGALRRNYGTASASYGPFAYSAFHRYGVSNALTLGARTEGTRKLSGIGLAATVVMGNAGVASIAVAASATGGRRGSAVSAGYNYQAKRWNMGFSVRRDSGQYATLGLPVTVTNRKYEVNAVIGANLQGSGSVSVSHTALGVRAQQPDPSPAENSSFSFVPLESRRTTAVTYSLPFLSKRMSLTATLSHIREKAQSRNELFLGLIYFFDKDFSAAANYRTDRISSEGAVLFTKNQPIGEGLGYVLSADRASGIGTTSTSGKSSVQYNAPAAIVRAEFGARRNDGATSADYRLSVAGGVAYVGGSLAFGRPVMDSFGIVKVGELPGVSVLVNNQEMGKTNAQGTLFVPTLSPYYDSDVSLVPSTLPIEYSVQAITRKISPSQRSGVLIDFGLTKIQAISGKLNVLQDGTLRPVENREASLTRDGKPLRFLTGRGGEFYLENLAPGTYRAQVELEGTPCGFLLTIPASDEIIVELGDVACRNQP